jgi:hypothetical protein
MHRSTVIAIAAVLAGCAVVAVAASDGGAAVARLRLVARIVHVNVLGDRYALKAGDKLLADGSVLLGRSGRRIGVAVFACTVTGAGRSVGGNCTATLHLPLGQITGRWPLTTSRGSRERPVTGGSGLYRGARGRFVLGPTRRNGDTPFTVDLAR